MRTKNVPGSYDRAVNLAGNFLDFQGEDIHDGIFIVENHFDDFGFSGSRSAVFLATARLAVQGNFLNDAVDGGHVVRIQHGEKGVILNNYLARQKQQRSLLTIRSRDKNSTCSAGCGRDTEELVVSDNFFYTNDAISLVLVKENSTGDVARGHDFIIERNFFSQAPESIPEAQTAVTMNSNAREATIRNNIVVMEDWQTFRGIEIGGSSAYVDNNTIYSPNANVGFKVRGVRFVGGSDQHAHNNLLYVPNTTNADVVENPPADSSNNILTHTNPFASSGFLVPMDFLLDPNAPAVDSGTIVPVFVDFDGTIRPVNGQYDVGAFEFIVPEPASCLSTVIGTYCLLIRVGRMLRKDQEESKF